MKQLIAILLALCLIPVADARRRWVPRAPAAGPNTWYDAGSAPDTGYNIGTNTIWSNVTVAASGSCTKLRFYCYTYYSTKTVYLALYSSQTGPLTGGTANVSVTGTGWFEATLASPVAVTAGTYQVAAVVDSGGIQVGGHADTGITCYLQGEGLPPAFPPATLVTNFSSYGNQSWGLGMYVQ